MRKPEDLLVAPPKTEWPAELELLAVGELEIHPELAAAQLLVLSGLAVTEAIKSAAEDEDRKIVT